MPRLSNREKAAILLISIGKTHAAQIYKSLSEEEIATLTLAITTTKSVTKEDREAVMNEFYETCVAQKFITEGGIDYARGVLNKALGDEKANEIMEKLTDSLQVRPFEFIRRADPTQIVHLISRENPQTIAMILSYLPAQKASQVLVELDDFLQVEVVKRMANMESVIPEFIREAEMVLEQRLAQMGTTDQTAIGGIDSVVQMISNVDRATERNILETLDMTDTDLAEEIRKHMFVFEDMIKLSPQSVQRVLKDVEQSDLIIALKGAGDDVKKFILSNVSKHQQEMILDDLEVMGPLKRRDVEDAQQKIVNVVRSLDDSGEIVISRGDGSDVVL
ncbi:MAG: flagellar motor switch protein FliG [Ruminococcaceae bacterium]|nr:flagellar motor switch protein FliG [Oscillospiraceae bacterium]